jgi:hypothetical protein
MWIRLGDLRRVIREAAGASAFPGQPIRNALSPDINDREQIGSLTNKAMDTVDDPDGLPEHLREPTVDREDCFGPVPPTAEVPYVQVDPYEVDTAPQPFSYGGGIKRG